MPFVKVATLADVPAGTMWHVKLEDTMVCIANIEGGLFAFESMCTHADAWLHEGFLDGYEVTCPVHYGAYDVRTGDATAPPAYIPVQTYAVRVRGEDVEIDWPDPLPTS